VKSFSVHVSLDSDEPPEKLAFLVKEAEMGCFTLGALRNPVEVAVTTRVNGQAFDATAFLKA
jgi:hypothetical protein